jgi:hypothetical protein
VLVIYKETIIMDRMAQSADLLRNLRLVLEGRINGQVSRVLAMVEELNGTWVAVVVNESPSSLNTLHALVDFSVKVHLF